MKGRKEAAGPLLVISPPSTGGVRDYAEIVADATGARHLSFDAVEGANGAIAPRRGDGGATIFIQVSPYGYQKRGVPLHLVKWARSQKDGGTRIGCYFHELYAFGPPWRSSFWLSPLQRYITGEMARLSDFWMTYGQASARWLLRAGGDKPFEVLPIFSNMGEAETYANPRSRNLAVCGSPGLRENGYRLAGPKLFRWAAELGLQIHDIGLPVADQVRRDLARHGVREHGRLPRPAVSRLLSEARYGLVAYPLAYVAKSGIYAAYCAHGVCPLVISKSHVSLDGLVPDEHYRVWQSDGIDGGERDRSVGHRAFEWYATHAISRHKHALLRFSGMRSADLSMGDVGHAR